MGRPEEIAATKPHEDEPPPPYTEDEAAAPPLPDRPKNNPFISQSQPASSNSKAEAPVKPTGPFPSTLNMYYTKALRTPTFHLGEQEDKPLYAATFHSGFQKKGSHVVLHSTPDPDSPALASAERIGRLGHRSLVTLPGPEPGSASVVEEMHAHVSITSVSYSFAVEVGQGADVRHKNPEIRREKFEWRSSRGGEVKHLGSGTVGRKLVRLYVEADGVGGTRAVRDQGATSDGKEIVAVWADNPKWSANRTGGFQFLGSGATGELGERFGVMAVITAVRIWELINETSLQAAATGSSAGGSAG
ncbi:hypothetical protein BJ170DRAFT_605712 [Xylariales sp. AK1849]|nr:hypothetical protein BJ170DRAFT_605712 [Xylariales sp. AK1849]